MEQWHLGHDLVLAAIHVEVAPSAVSLEPQRRSSAHEAGLCALDLQAKQNECPAPQVTRSSSPAPPRPNDARTHHWQPGSGHHAYEPWCAANLLTENSK